MKTLAKSIVTPMAALGLAGAALTPALAAEPQRMTIRVGTADLNLSTPYGQKVLDQRIERAVRNVCRTTDLKAGSRILSKDARACIAKARSSARLQVASLIKDQQRGG